MNFQPRTIEPEDDPDRERAGGQAAEDAAYYRGVLHELVEMGVELARAVQARALAEPSVELVAAFDGLAQTVRRTVALARKVAEPVRPARSPALVRAGARRQVIRAVEDSIQREVDDEPGERLRAELSERMDRPELEDDLASRPVAEIIAEICRDLGLEAPAHAHPWKRRMPADVAALCAMAARPAALGWDGRPRGLEPGTPAGATGEPAGPSG